MKFPKTVEWVSFLSRPYVIAEANEIADAKKQAGDTRTRAQKFTDSLNGLALQYAVLHAMMPEGAVAAPRSDKSYDLLIPDGDDMIKVDVKGMFKSGTTTFGQTPWEKIHASSDTIYACYDCRSNDGIGHYKGWCVHGAFTPSKKNNGTYIYPDRLNR